MGESVAIGLFVSCREGLPVTRYGTRTLIGAERDPDQPSRIVYRPEQIVAIPLAEAVKYAREYRRAIAAGALVERSESEWRAAREKLEPGPAVAARGKQRSAEREGESHADS